MKSLFPDMEKEIQQDRIAARREVRQHALAYLGKHEKAQSWIVNYLLENGPVTEHTMSLAALETEYFFEDGMDRLGEILGALVALHQIGKLWRVSLGIHPGSGVECFRWGIRRVHSPNTKENSHE